MRTTRSRDPRLGAVRRAATLPFRLAEEAHREQTEANEEAAARPAVSAGT